MRDREIVQRGQLETVNQKLKVNESNSLRPIQFSRLSSENAHEFLRLNNKYAQNTDLQENTKIQIFEALMTNLASNWYKSLDNAVKAQWNLIQEAFTNKYINQNNLRWLSESALLNCQQESQKNVEVYLSRLLEQAIRLNKNDEEKKNLFIRGLRTSIQPFVLGTEPNTLDQAVAKARLSELHPIQTPVVAAMLPDQTGKIEQCLQGITNLLTTQNNKLQSNADEMQSIRSNMVNKPSQILKKNNSQS